MAFENVNVPSLKNAINACRSTLNCNYSLQLINNISNNDVWCAASRDNLKRALETLTNIRYKELEKKLDSYLNVAQMIEEYQNLQSTNADMQVQINNLNSKLYRLQEESVDKTDSDGSVSKETTTKKVKDYSVQNRIDKLKSDIITSERRMDEIKSRVAAAL
jgi:chromosome segregation ATPase